MNTKFRTYLLVIIGLILMLAVSCKKKEKQDVAPVPTSTKGQFPDLVVISITDITSNSATCNSKIWNDDGAHVTARGVCWGAVMDPAITGNHTTDGSDTGSFKSNITGLYPNVNYYVRAYVTNSAGTFYSINTSFKTNHAGIAIGDN